jgi:hypothetical protein
VLFINALSSEQKARWKEALEMTDIEELSYLSKEKGVPSELRSAVQHHDYRFLLQLDERIGD